MRIPKRIGKKKQDQPSSSTSNENKQALDLQRSEAQLRLLVQTIPLAFYTYKKSNRKTIWYSEQIEYLTGFTISQLKESEYFWRDRINKSDYQQVEGTFDRLKEPNQKVSCEYRWKDAQNQEIWIYDQAILIGGTSKKNQQVIGCFMDISERKQAELSITESERNYREIFNSTTDAILIHNAVTGKTEDVNETMLSMFKVNYQEALSLSFNHFSLGEPPYDIKYARKKLDEALTKGKCEFEWLAKRKNGELFWANVNLISIILNNEAKVMAIVKDINQKKQDEEKLEYRDAFEKVILDISTRFINVPIRQVDVNMIDALEKICMFSNTSVAYVFLYDDIDETLSLKYHWNNNQIKRDIEKLSKIPQKLLGWQTTRIKSGQVVKFKRSADIPEEAAELRKLVHDQNIHSFVDVPLVYQKEVIGFLGLGLEKSGREWFDEEIALLKILGQTFVNAIKRKEAGERIIESEQTHREIYNATNEAIIVHHIESGKFEDVNKAFLHMFGFSYAELNDTSFAHISSGNDPYTEQNALDLIKNTLKYGPQIAEWHSRKKDQSLFWIEISMKVAEIRGEKKILSVIRDISEKKIAAEQLKQNEEKYRLLVESQTDLLVKVDPDGKFIFVSPTYCELFAKTEEELLGNSFMPLVHKDDQKATELAMKKLFEPPHTCYVEQRAMTRLGWRWIAWSDKALLDKHGNVHEIIGVGRDITYQKGVEEALRRSEDRFRSIVQQLSDIVIICDKDSNIIYDTPSINSILGHKEGYLVGQNIFSIIHPEDHELALSTLREILSIAHNNMKAELRIKQRDGDFTPMETMFINLLEHPTIKGIVITMRDITERKMLDKKVLDAVIKTEEQERERFAKNLHDDLGPLLSSIKMYVNSFNSAKDEGKREFIVSQLNEVVKEAITTTKEVSNDLSPHILINYGLVSAIENFIKKIPSDIEVKFHSTLSSERYSNSIENSFYRIVKELINNSLKHAEASQIKIRLEEKGQQLSLDYHDNGRGADWKDIRPEKHKGMGISNIISRAKSLNGVFDFQVRKGYGFSFTISIPIHQSLD